MNKKFTILISCYIIIISIFIYVGIELNKQLNEKSTEILKLKEQLNKSDFKILELEEHINEKSIDSDNKDKELNVLSEEIKKLKEDLNKYQEELKQYEDLKSYNVTATAYTAYCDGCSGFTKNETDVRNTIYKDGLRVIAVDQKLIPLNSVLFVETKNEKFFAIADDTGGAIKGKKIDVLVPNKNIAKEFGRQHDVKVTVVKEG